MTAASSSDRRLTLAAIVLSVSVSGFSVIVARADESATLIVEDADPAFVLARRGKSADLASLLEREPDAVRRRNSVGETPLHAAAFEGSSEAIKLLAARGAELEVRDKGGRTPLHRAAWRNPEAVEALVLLGADPEARVWNGNDGKLGLGRSVLSIAASSGNLKGVEFLLEKGVPITYGEEGRRNALHDACTVEAGGWTDAPPEAKANGGVIDLLVQRLGGDVNLKSRFFVSRTPLQVAASFGAVETVEHLLRTYPKIDLEAKDDDNNTALHLAAYTQGHRVAAERRAAVIRLLRAYGERRDVVNIDGLTPAALALKVGDAEVLEAFKAPPPKPLRSPGDAEPGA